MPDVRADARSLVRLTLPVGGMTCAACTAHVSSALKEVPGVADASADLLTRSATVTFDAGAVDPHALVEAVRETGYEADLPSGREALLERQRKDDADQAREARSLLVRALSLLGGMVALMVIMAVAPRHMAHGPLDAALLVATAVAAFAGARPIFVRAIAAAKRGTTQMDTLVALGATVALASSAVSVLGGPGDVYFEGVLGILGFVTLGNALEARAKRSTTRALVALASLESKRARIEADDGGVRDLDVEELRRGDVLLVRPGERVPADAEIVEGESELDESMLTGEPMPQKRKKGERIVGGTINGSGVLRAKVTALGDESVLAQMVRLMREAQGRRAPIQRLADRASAVFVPAVVALAVVVLAAWLGLGFGWPHAIRAATAVLVVACPCAMGLAVPTAVMVATGRAAKRGIVVKGGDALERAAAVDTVVFDKTGTLTVGKPRVVTGEDRALALAASLERGSEHPIAKAVLDEVKARGLKPARAKDVVVTPGEGVGGVVDGKPCFVGTPRRLEGSATRDGAAGRGEAPGALAGGAAAQTARTGAGAPSDDAAASRAPPARGPGASPQPGTTDVIVVEDGRTLGTLTIADAVRETAKPAVDALRARGIHVVMLTGDRAESADRVAEVIGIDDVRADVLPAGKVDTVRALQAEGRKVAMIGDGINDAAALAQADVGIAMGGGTDVAVEAADLSLVRADLGLVPLALDLSRAALSTMRRNLFWAVAYNVVALPVAAGALEGIGVVMSPVVASACMSLSSVSVVLSSLLLGRRIAR